MLIARVVVFLVGIAVVLSALSSAIRTFVLPRSAPEPISRTVFIAVRYVFMLALRRANSYAKRDALMAYFAPVSLLLLVPVWLVFIFAGYMAIFWATGVASPYEAFRDSGSSLLTLGFATIDGFVKSALAFSEASIGLIMVALLIAYLPTMYSAFSRRETAVSLLEVRAGDPPSAVEMILRFQRIHGLGRLSEQWRAWEVWFADIEESHTSLPALVFFRSPKPEHSWVTAAGAVLDAASLIRSTVDVPADPQADLCIRAGYLALRHICDFFDIPYNPNPHPGDMISITRGEYDAVCDQLAAGNVPLKPDREQAWLDYGGWRVNYDTELLDLAALTMAPYAPWSSDRSRAYRRPPILPRWRRVEQGPGARSQESEVRGQGPGVRDQGLGTGG